MAVKYATNCTGVNTVGMALRAEGIPSVHVHASESKARRRLATLSACEQSLLRRATRALTLEPGGTRRLRVR